MPLVVPHYRPTRASWTLALAVLVTALLSVVGQARAAETYPLVDNFERTSLGSDWVGAVYPGAPSTPKIVSGRLQMPTDAWGSAYWAKTKFGDHQQISATKTAPGSVGLGVCLRNPGVSLSNFSLELDKNGAFWLWKAVDGRTVELFRAYSAGGTVGVGDRFGLKVKDGKVEVWLRKAGETVSKLVRRVADPDAVDCSGYMSVTGYEGALDFIHGGGSDPVDGIVPAPTPPPVTDT
ncbi:MAG: hypothetical protein JHC95_19490, partial [Solirubrobacteraceae bacterium]|nr:hypothetical protein [Solirubrobacteraceae bacterium]